MVKVKTQGAAPVPANAVPNQPAAGGAATATAEAPAKEKKSRKSSKRADFGEGQPGWIGFCEYKKLRCLDKSQKMIEAANAWEAKKAGEHLQTAEKKLKRIEKLKKALAALEAEVATPVAAKK